MPAAHPASPHVDPPLHLVPLRADLPELQFIPGPAAIIGRLPSCDAVLPPDDVSRRHAEVRFQGNTWSMRDLGSSAGTRIEQMVLSPGEFAPLADGDQVVLAGHPFLVRVGVRAADPSQDENAARFGGAIEDGHMTRRLTPAADRPDLRHFAMIMRELAACRDRRELFDRVARIAVDDTGCGRAAVVEPGGVHARRIVAVAFRRNEPEVGGANPTTGGGFETIAGSGAPSSPDARPPTSGWSTASAPEDAEAADRPYSRRLVDAALAGDAVEIDARQDDGHTFATFGIHWAAAVPITVGMDVRGCLYLDCRAGDRPAHPDAITAAELLALAVGLALGNLRRAELEIGQQRFQLEMDAAQEAQHHLLPPARGIAGPIRWSMRMQPGMGVAGDLFDVVPIDDERTAIVVGDVAGHGLGAALQMAMVLSIIRAELQRSGDLPAAVGTADRMAADSLQLGRFVTLWAAIIGPEPEVQFVNAGHGHVLVRHADGGVESPPMTIDLPVGLGEGRPPRLQSLTLGDDDRLLIFSDGLSEQADRTGDRFGNERLVAAAAQSGGEVPSCDELVHAISSAVDDFRAEVARGDDTTVVALQRTGSARD
ncbi:MAG: SpoIIE family protein phosphatase [Phycisphaerales bacterium]